MMAQSFRTENGYNPSIMQTDLTRCYLCGRSCEKLDRHEVFHGPFRQKAKRAGLWVMLCHERCHIFGPMAVHRNRDVDLMLKQEAQRRAMDYYGLTTDDFIREFSKNYL